MWHVLLVERLRRPAAGGSRAGQVGGVSRHHQTIADERPPASVAVKPTVHVRSRRAQRPHVGQHPVRGRGVAYWERSPAAIPASPAIAAASVSASAAAAATSTSPATAASSAASSTLPVTSSTRALRSCSVVAGSSCALAIVASAGFMSAIDASWVDARDGRLLRLRWLLWRPSVAARRQVGAGRAPDRRGRSGLLPLPSLRLHIG